MEQSDTIERSLVIGASGQIGTELILKLGELHGTENVVAADIRPPASEELSNFTYEHLNILNDEQLKEVIARHNITTVYLLAAMLSATAEQQPERAWDLNMVGLFNVLNLAKDKVIKKVFWPSSIAVFGPSTPSENTPQTTVCEPNTVYGISKLAGERWCEYYHANYGVDVRSIRYPGLIGYKSAPGGGTTDYAVDIYYKALEEKPFTCFLNEDTRLPIMFMEDAIQATIQLMTSPAEKLSVRSSYNISGMDFTPKEIAASIQNHIPSFAIDYAPDFRQKIADSWPSSIDDRVANKDWGWKASYDLDRLTEVMLQEVAKKKMKLETL